MKQNTTTDKVNELILSEMEKGEIPRQQTWNCEQISGATGKSYGLTNQLLLQIAKKNKSLVSNRWVTRNVLQDLGGRVKAGEKGSFVIFFKMLPVQKEDKEKLIPFLRYSTVFNLSQTNLDNVQETDLLKSSTAEQLFDNLIEKPVIEYGKPAYQPKADIITIPNPNDFVSIDEYYSVLLHELSHRTGAKHRLNRKGIVEFDKFGSEQYSQEELIAELGKAYMGNKVGLTIDRPNTGAYMKGRMKYLKEHPTAFVEASGQAGKVVEYVTVTNSKVPIEEGVLSTD